LGKGSFLAIKTLASSDKKKSSRLGRGVAAPELCLLSLPFSFLHRNRVSENHYLSSILAFGQTRSGDKLFYVSETQTAECRSSKPVAAGSNPVAHFDFGFWFWFFRSTRSIPWLIVGIFADRIAPHPLKSDCQFTTARSFNGKTSVSKTEVPGSNPGGPAGTIRWNLESELRKARQIGVAAVSKTAASDRLEVRVLRLPSTFISSHDFPRLKKYVISSPHPPILELAIV
jgi:hypothetical protein